MNIGTIIRELREEAGISQGDLANACGLNRTYLSKIEREKRKPGLNALEKIAGVLKVPVPVLYFLAVDDSTVPDHKKEAFRQFTYGAKGILKEYFPVAKAKKTKVMVSPPD